jgi:prophage regulatory protein
MASETDLPRILDSKELARMIPYSMEHIRRLENDGKFPRRIRLGPARVGWLLSAVQEWIAKRVEESRSADRGAPTHNEEDC